MKASLKGAMVDIKDGRMTMLLLHTVQGFLAPEYHSYDLYDGKTLEEVREKYQDHSETDFYRLVVSAVMYISTMPEDMVAELNNFPREGSKAVVLKKYYSNYPIKHFGKFFTLPRVYSEKEIRNKGHFAFRRAGEGRQFLKFTWVRPSKPYVKGATT